ncbi:MAG TPA: hypothetical protein VFQ05_16185 [Candidatus Eisenbacteria bacterium]|nr:hypothetical protein [Candidatus Eisenbacteria bacterium]
MPSHRSPVRSAWAWIWASPATALGLVVAAVCVAGRGRIRRRDGVFEVRDGWARVALERWVPIRGGAEALTLGHVILGRSEEALRRFAAHERVHVRQYERWGPFFLPAYACASLWAWTLGGDPYLDNVFEREAHALTRRPRDKV